MADRDELLSHNYDGIEEYDNDLPKWWVWMFWLTLVFAVVRVAYYHYGPGELQEERLAASMSELEKTRAENKPAEPAKISDENLLAKVSDEATLAEGKRVYDSLCAACHMPQGQGLVGPNLTDDYWLHGGTLLEIRQVIIDGVPAKGMIPWKERLSAEEINAVTVYIWTLRGTNPPNAKEAQGELVVRQ